MIYTQQGIPVAVNNREVSQAEETADLSSTNAFNSSILGVKKQYTKIKSSVTYRGETFIFGDISLFFLKANTGSAR